MKSPTILPLSDTKLPSTNFVLYLLELNIVNKCPTNDVINDLLSYAKDGLDTPQSENFHGSRQQKSLDPPTQPCYITKCLA